MCIFDCRRRSNRHILMDCLRYEAFNCKMCKNLKTLDKLQFCGKFFILQVGFSDFPLNLQTFLIKLQNQSNYIQCKKCKQLFFLDQKDNHLLVSKFTCIHKEKYEIKKCLCCKKISEQKSYQKCKKCQLPLFYFDVQRQVECPRCKMKCCETCKQETQLFQQKKPCNCKIIRYQKRVNLFQFLSVALFVLIITSLIGSHYLEDSEFYQSIVCTIKDGYSNVNCTLEQLYYDTFKQLILFLGITLVMGFGVGLIDIIRLLNITQRKLSNAQTRRF
ncbi:unnamed protein product (macronuclear) [Paramecium tetraurelia]|uniref:Transmembrane protein n=1 Tax=Paramecium tetraurelia TaxID=5888 RepID=A0C304_PARTE|nr:uncharacterized protein GSPATT00034649001 [Paramecium tetraurelia]CAK65171.1 unnamed protein product [Paramecium tetraurelia]|eukprot:XP_001432568.1 hypothetical protein (macronuclear) [Paramecium tetraurelia strain d4-2]